tara:strand:- start:2630 stop:3457 length:828 start_codon:yes stop_codon:yes gene_type:complete
LAELGCQDAPGLGGARRAMASVMLLDSGVGGLSVLDELRSRLPEVDYSYVLDNAFSPYGEKSEDALKSRVLWLMERVLSYQWPDILVVACNTLSTLVLPDLRSRWGFDIVGVVPAIKPAAKLSRRKSIGLLATPATVGRRYTEDLFASFASDCEFISYGSSRLVSLAEQKLAGDPVCLKALGEEVAPLLNAINPPDTIVLGCTHFPLLRGELEALYPEILFVDSGASIAARVSSLLVAEQKVGHVGTVYLTEQSRASTLQHCLQVRNLENVVILE